MTEWYDEEAFAQDFIEHALIERGGKMGRTFVYQDGNTVEYANPEVGRFLITVVAAELNGAA